MTAQTSHERAVRSNARHEFVKQQCGTCGGSGRVSKKSGHGFYPMDWHRHRRPTCSDCLGKGHHEVRRERLDLGWDAPALSSNHPATAKE